MVNRRLDSWKQIADHLGRDVTTAIRWERERGLPVRRLPGGKRQGVFAYSDEIDAWRDGRSSEPNEGGAEPNGAVPEEKAPGSTPPAPPAVLVDPVSLPDGIGRRRWTGGWRLAVGITLCLGALVAAGSVAFVFGRNGVAARAGLLGERLVAWDDAGKVAWTHDLGEAGKTFIAQIGGDARYERATVLDLDGDGISEVLAVVTYRSAAIGAGDDMLAEDELICFSAKGRVLWRYVPRFSFRFGGRSFVGPWHLMHMVVSERNGQRGVWLSLVAAPWWPAVVVRLDPAGLASLRFVNSGVIYALKEVEAPRPLMLAAGVNNEYGQAILAVLDAADPPATSPQTPGSYLCQGCPPGRPERYFLLPRSEVSLLRHEPYVKARRIGLFARGVEVRTYETEDGFGAGHYRFSLELEPEGLAMDDGYWQLHERLRQESALDHPGAACPLLKGVTIRRWDRSGTWTDLEVAVAHPPGSGGPVAAFGLQDAIGTP